MPWKKSFDEDHAIQNAMQVFWAKGYEAASISDLTDALQVNRSSLYNAFGGKEALFLKSLQRYEEDRKALLAELEALDQPVLAIHRFIDTVVDSSASDEQKKGCFLFNTVQEIGVHGDQVTAVVNAGVFEVERFLQRCLEVAQVRQQIEASIQPEVTAKLLLAAIIAIRSLGRGVYKREELEIIAEQAKRLVKVEQSH